MIWKEYIFLICTLKVLVVLTDYSEIAFVVWAKKGGIFSSLFRTQLCHQLRHWIGQESRLSQYKLSKNTYLTVSFREGSGTPPQGSCLENPMDGGAWWAAVHGVVKSGTWLSNFTITFHFHALENEMATHSSVLAWRIPGTGEPGGLPSMGSHRVGCDWSDLAAAAAA